MKKTTRFRALSLLLCVLLFAAAWTCTGCGKQQETDASSEADVQVKDAESIGEGAKSFYFEATDPEGNTKAYLVHTDEESVGAALLALDLIAGEDSAYGLYVKTVLGTTVDFDKDGKYWAFYIDGEYAMTGVDATEITEGAVYAFRAE